LQRWLHCKLSQHTYIEECTLKSIITTTKDLSVGNTTEPQNKHIVLLNLPCNTSEQSKPTKGFMKGHKPYDSVREKVMNGTDTAPSQVTGQTKSKVSPGLE
jgi:hypothetical protein